MKDYLHARKKLFAQALIQTFPFSCVHKTDWFPIAFPAYQTLWFFIFSFIAEFAYEILYLINQLIRFSFPEGVFPRKLKCVANSVRPALKIDARGLHFVHNFSSKEKFSIPSYLYDQSWYLSSFDTNKTKHWTGQMHQVRWRELYFISTQNLIFTVAQNWNIIKEEKKVWFYFSQWSQYFPSVQLSVLLYLSQTFLLLISD